MNFQCFEFSCFEFSVTWITSCILYNARHHNFPSCCSFIKLKPFWRSSTLISRHADSMNFLDSLSLLPYTYSSPSLLASPLDGIHCQNRVFAGQSILIHPCIKDHRKTLLMSCPYFPSIIQHLFLILLGCFVRWAASGYTTVVLSNIAPRICSKQHAASLCSSHLVIFFKQFVKLNFSSNNFKWCNHTIALTLL